MVPEEPTLPLVPGPANGASGVGQKTPSAFIHGSRCRRTRPCPARGSRVRRPAGASGVHGSRARRHPDCHARRGDGPRRLGGRHLCRDRPLEVVFHRPTPIETPLRAEGEVTASRARVHETRARLLLPDGTVSVEGTGTFVELPEGSVRAAESLAAISTAIERAALAAEGRGRRHASTTRARAGVGRGAGW